MQLNYRPIREGHFVSEKNKQIYAQLRVTEYWKRVKITASQQHTREFFHYIRT